MIQSLRNVRPLYVLPDDPLSEEVLIPGFQRAHSVNCMIGFFSSHALASLAPGLATYITTTRNSLRLIVNPILQPQDLAAIQKGAYSTEAMAADILDNFFVAQDLLQNHTLTCLSWLIRTARIEIKVALMKNALFHPKVWLFHAPDGILVAHGSSNATVAGLSTNVEQVAVSRSWLDSTQRYVADKLQAQFDRFWSDHDESCIVVPLPRAIRDRLVHSYHTDAPPTEADLSVLYRRASSGHDHLRESTLPPILRPRFVVPPGLSIDTGPFAHQGKAVHAWCDAQYQGILEMATGSGKTIAALLCAHRLHQAHHQLLIVVAAPYIPLIQQWCEEIAQFGLQPTNLSLSHGTAARTRELRRLRRRLLLPATNVQIIVVSHDTLCDSTFQGSLRTFDCPTLLIADEVHNLGRSQFINDPPLSFNYRLGLSATPIRQYDDLGTEALSSYFGPVVFRYGLQEAIGNCLVEYDYYVHTVNLTPEEHDRWTEVTATIRANAWRSDQGEPDDYLVKLFRDRRAILENAANKIAALNTVLEREGPRTLRHALIYASDKAPQQLVDVNALLRAHRVQFHQLTADETANRARTAQILRSFRDGAIRVLTAKRVLDEGINIPQVQIAFLLASTTVERQWVQRRGRLLRKCNDTAKTHAVIHDFVTLPPDKEAVDDDTHAIARSELARVQQFASLARNAGTPDGPLVVIRKLLSMI